MTRPVKFIGVLFAGMLFALALSLFTPADQAAAQACDPSGSVTASASPTTVLPGQSVTFTAWGFTAGEEVSFWFTLPDQSVFGTARPLCCAASDGYVRFAPLTLPAEFYQYPGRWAMTVQGSNSQHASVAYFCVQTQAQPTNTAVPPTATTAPPTATTAPATATSVPGAPTDTPAAGSPTAAATTEATAAATTEATAVPTTAPIETAAPLPTTPPFIEPTPTAVTGGIGMPGTGAGPTDMTWLVVVFTLLGLMLVCAGWLYSRVLGARR